jgi:hypothetical protein
MAWLCRALVGAGFLAVAVDHHGNSFVDGYLPEGFAFWWERPRDLSFVLDRLGDDRPAGAAGFPLGGYTAAALVGARVDEGLYRALLAGELPLPARRSTHGCVRSSRPACRPRSTTPCPPRRPATTRTRASARHSSPVRHLGCGFVIGDGARPRSRPRPRLHSFHTIGTDT